MINYLRILGTLIVLKSNWFSIILNKTISLPINFVKLGNGVRFKIKENKIGKADISMLSEIWYYKYYNPAFMKIHKNDVVFDIGANNGFFTVYASLEARDGRVIAFEPVKELFEKIKINIKLNKLTNVSVENIAISNKNTFEKFFISKVHNGCHSLFKRNDSDEQIEVKNLKLEKYCLKKNIDHIDFLKLDCEGAEYDIILNLTIDFISKIKRISLEYHDDITNHKHEEIAAFLKKNNFIVDCRNGFLYAINKNY